MDDFVLRGNLFEIYGGLLKENQQRASEYHIIDDMSFTEIGEEMGISRQAAQELFNRADRRLRETEQVLGLSEKLIRIRTLAQQLSEETGDPAAQRLSAEIIREVSGNGKERIDGV